MNVSHPRSTTLVLGGVLLSISFLAGVLPPTGESEPSAVPPWFDAAWGYRMKVTGSSVLAQGGPIRDYNLVIRLTSVEANVFNHARNDGADLLITKRDGQTVLPREIVTYDSGQHQAEIWVRVDTLSTSARDFYLYYGNPLSNLPQADPGAWPSELLAVYHMNDDPGAGLVTDSGTQQNDARAGIQAGFTSSDTIAGMIGGAWRFNGTTHWIDGDGLVSSDSSFTISAWFACWNQHRPEDADFAFSVESGFWHLSAKRNYLQRVPDAIGNNGFYTWPPNPLPDTLLHYYVWSMDGVADTIRFYYDGVEQTPLARYSPSGKRVYTGFNLGGHIGIASPLFGSNPLDLMEGIVDEFRIRQGVTSSARVASEYRNQKSKLFLTFGPEEPFGFVAVQLLAFKASWAGDEAEITWELAGNSQTAIRLYRESHDSLPVLIAEAFESQGRIFDPGAPASGASYRMDVRDPSGELNWFGPILLGPRSPSPSRLMDIAPNPFRAGIRITFRVDEDGEVRLRMFDLRGREVVKPWIRRVAAGNHEMTWDGWDDRGRRLPAGMYLLRLETPSGAVTRKLTRVP